jgi:hypothetical protein
MQNVLGKELRIEFIEESGAPRESDDSPTVCQTHSIVDRARDFIPGKIVSQKGDRDG